MKREEGMRRNLKQVSRVGVTGGITGILCHRTWTDPRSENKRGDGPYEKEDYRRTEGTNKESLKMGSLKKYGYS